MRINLIALLLLAGTANPSDYKISESDGSLWQRTIDASTTKRELHFAITADEMEKDEPYSCTQTPEPNWFQVRRGIEPEPVEATCYESKAYWTHPAKIDWRSTDKPAIGAMETQYSRASAQLYFIFFECNKSGCMDMGEELIAEVPLIETGLGSFVLKREWIEKTNSRLVLRVKTWTERDVNQEQSAHAKAAIVAKQEARKGLQQDENRAELERKKAEQARLRTLASKHRPRVERANAEYQRLLLSIEGDLDEDYIKGTSSYCSWKDLTGGCAVEIERQHFHEIRGRSREAEKAAHEAGVYNQYSKKWLVEPDGT